MIMEKKLRIKSVLSDMVAHTYHPNTREADVEESQTGGQPGLYSKFMASSFLLV
jgi:hypothetical protein